MGRPRSGPRQSPGGGLLACSMVDRARAGSRSSVADASRPREGPLIRSTPSSPRWAGTPICRCSVSAAPSPDSEAGTTHASRLGVCNASLVHDWVQWRSRWIN